jgi:threonylcarbamoyladenosine tRNA methylthiotransferase MtaB
VKYTLITFGCRVNHADSLAIEEQLMAAGGAPGPVSDADLVVVNSCSVTGAADQGTRQIVRKIARDRPTARIVVTGCYATRAGAELAGLPGVVHIVPNHRKESFAEEIGLTTAERFGGGDGACGAEIGPGLADRTAFTLRVQTGCDQSCSFCIIPTTRGKGRSVPIPQVLEEISRLQRAGYREVAITGVHLGSYGRDLRDGSSLLGLLKAIALHASDIRFRISSLEPMDCSDAIVDLVAGEPRFAPHLHLPLQHASDRLLTAMRRPYTAEYFRRLAARVRRQMPHAALGSDVVVGFPGETDEDFGALHDYLEQSPLTHVHVFPYSDRPGTPASSLPGKVHGSIVRERAKRLRDVGAELTARFHRGQVGSTRPALTIEDGTLAVTDNYLKVRIAEGLRRNASIRVAVGLEGGRLVGQIV